MKSIPIGSKSFQERNRFMREGIAEEAVSGAGWSHTANPTHSADGSTPSPAPYFLRIVIAGQIRGGKNNMIVTRTGLHFPKPEWAAWRDQAVQCVKRQIPAGFKIINKPVNIGLYYWAGDKRRRDFPAICDSVWHVLEKSGVVSDDTFLWVASSTKNFDNGCPRCEIVFY